jgi:hypothetical protein
MNATEIECPICDRKVQSDMMRCPNCGADLGMSSFADLEEVAKKLSTSESQEPLKAEVYPKEVGPRSDPKVEVKQELPPPEKKVGTKAPVEPKKEENTIPDPSKDESKHGLGRLFGKKKR